VTTNHITQFFRSAAGADWKSPAGGLSPAEFKDALKQKADGHDSFDRPEFMNLGRSLGLSRGDSRAVFHYLAHKGNVSVATLQDQLIRSVGKNQPLTLGELKGGVDKLVDRSRQARGDHKIDHNKFTAIAHREGIKDPHKIKYVFDQIAGSDHEISPKEMEKAFGSKPSRTDFVKKFDHLASQWTFSLNKKDGQATIHLGSTYTIRANEHDAGWTLINNQTGAKTKIWGDPHVDIGADGKQDFHFKKNMTFHLAGGTNITVGTVKANGPNGPTLTSSLTITNGNNAIKVTGLGMGKDGAHNLNIAQSNDGKELGKSHGDITLFERGDGWVTKQGNPVTQAIIDKAEGQGSHKIDKSQFTAMANAAGINNPKEIASVFSLIARGGDEISEDELKKFFPSHLKFREEFNKLVPRRTSS